MSRAKILVVDDDEKIIFAFREMIKKDGYAWLEARDGREALKVVETEKPDLIFMDINMPHLDGHEALREIKSMDETVPVIVITGEGNVQNAIKSMKQGAFDYLTKPLSLPKIRQAIREGLASRQVPPAKTVRFEADVTNRHQLIGNSRSIQQAYKMIGSIATTPNHTSVLLLGESGTGKELAARTIHFNSQFPDEPFVAINCTALPETLLESELFGHEKGAFTNAVERKPGKFEVARKGTIFLDEIGDLSPNLQQKLLRVLQEREFERVGGHSTIPVEARFIAATNQELRKKVNEGTFREDLYYRIHVVVIELPPLRDRHEDILMLAHYFLERYNQKLKKDIRGFSDNALDLLQSYSYPGNIRELENLVERAVMLTRGPVILAEAFSDLSSVKTREESLPIASTDFAESRDYLLNLFEKQFLTQALQLYNGNISAMARGCGMSRQNVHRLLQKHGLAFEPSSLPNKKT
ncbi:hypothetical protein A2V82_13685 [candidate division KSB1 bacterium RBG_16_48_16]|nr:MAG: hypothetical protein A2V82_13685 [candidate division KSB1 bacterium RBG_16_48_16]